jgi:hypothetical protein
MPIGSTNVYNTGDLILSTVSGSGTSFIETKIAAATSSLILFNSSATLTSQSLNSTTVGTSSYVSGSTSIITNLTASNISASGTSSFGYVGIGTSSPVQKFHIDGVVGNPATSGTVQNGIVRLSNTTDNAVLDIGMRAGGAGAWLQSTDETSLAANYSLLLNPNGGNVGIGTTGPAQRLDVRGYVVSDVGSNAVEGGFYLGNSGHGLRRPGGSSNDVYLYTTS